MDIDGEMLYTGSEAHNATGVGDTVGDPFIDTSGPSLNILIKLRSVVALVIAPFNKFIKSLSIKKGCKYLQPFFLEIFFTC